MNEKTPSISFQHRMDSIKEQYSELGNLAIKLNGKGLELLQGYDEETYESIVEDSHRMDVMTIDLERACIKFMATEQPLAGDLMFIESTIRVTSHIKRIGHLVLKIANAIRRIHTVSIPDEILRELEFMGDARQLADDDDKIDDLYDSILTRITETMAGDAEMVPYIIDTIFLARYFERIADKAVSIGSRTIFMITLKRPGIDY